MIEVTVQFYNLLAHLTGIRDRRLALPAGASVKEAIRRLSEDYPAAFQSMLLPDGNPGGYLKVFLNGRLLDLDALDTPLGEGDELMLFPASSGG